MRCQVLVLVGLVAMSCGATAGPAPVVASSPLGASATVTPTPAPTLRPPWLPESTPRRNNGEVPRTPEGTYWISITSFDGRTIVAAVMRSGRPGPAPVVIYLHSDEGLLQRDMDFGASLAKEGFLTLIPCWQGLVQPNPRVEGCTAGALLRRLGGDVARDISAVADVARTLPGARADRTVAVGHSGGGTAALLAGSMGGRVDAVVPIAATYGMGIRERWQTSAPDQVDGLSVPVLIVHGTEDFQAPGTRLDAAQAYAKTATEKGKKIETLYLDGAGHQPMFGDRWTPEVVRKLVAFLTGSA